MKYIAHVISFIFHPLIIISYLLMLLLIINPYLFSVQNERALNILIIYVVMLTIIMPGLTVMLMRAMGFVNSIHLKERTERIIPLIITGGFYLWLFVNIYENTTIPLAFSIFVLGSTIGLFLTFFFSLFTKVSLHTTGVGGFFVGILLIKYNFSYESFGLELGSLGSYVVSTDILIFLSLFIAGVVGTSRLLLQAHSLKEVSIGYLIGIISQLIAFSFLFT
ncbi:hypothetical protein [Portibacter marinus]|uniref:hypothetical protein n=1 Tax=Portibacter marinus TaxID=2898660 RepID=UPI001F39D16A|nr:hypothetical protein [Portibacter marinus]